MSDAGLAVTSLIVFCFLGGTLMMLPRAVEPYETPGLALPAAEVEEVLRRDARRARRAPRGDLARAVVEMVATLGRAEAGAGIPRREAQRGALQLRSAVHSLRQDDGEEAVAALRARATLRLEDALSGELDEEEARGLLGSFPEMLERYGLTEDGERVAPPFAVRTLFVARWNTLVGLDPTDGMAGVERQAYWGWLALSATGVEPRARLGAAERYAEAGGARAEEARAVLLYQAGRFGAAQRAFSALFEEEGSVRYRNHSLAAVEAAAGEPDRLDREPATP